MEEDTWNKIIDIRVNGSLSPFQLSYFLGMELSSPFFENLPSIVFKTPSVPLLGDRNLPYPFSKITPSLFTLKEGSTSHLGLLPSGKKRETALLGARNRYALRLADHQRSRQIVRDGTAGMLLGI